MPGSSFGASLRACFFPSRLRDETRRKMNPFSGLQAGFVFAQAFSPPTHKSCAASRLGPAEKNPADSSSIRKPRRTAVRLKGLLQFWLVFFIAASCLVVFLQNLTARLHQQSQLRLSLLASICPVASRRRSWELHMETGLLLAE